MTIQHKEKDKHGVFFIEDEGEILAQLVYGNGGNNTIIIEHTEVDQSLQGKNIGFELVNKTVEYARKHGLKISVVCPFAKKIFDKRADFGDVLAPHP